MNEIQIRFDFIRPLDFISTKMCWRLLVIDKDGEIYSGFGNTKEKARKNLLESLSNLHVENKVLIEKVRSFQK